MKYKIIIRSFKTVLLVSSSMGKERAEKARRELSLFLLKRNGYSVRMVEATGGVKPAEVPGSQDDDSAPEFEDLPECVERQHHPLAAFGILEED